MQDLYEPESDFLNWVASGDAPLVGSAFADANLRHVLKLMRDESKSNRDWATFLLAQQEEVDTPVVREAFLVATQDVDPVVRGEALLGLALRDKELALPLVKRELEGEDWGSPLFEAAQIIAHPSLVDALRRWAGSADGEWINNQIDDAIAACEGKRCQPQ